ncbi:ATP-binding protein [Prescottella agglutinans]|uniref:ATPase/DNA-binding CsgD family transcriptional regulator n=1 Tax=Prescottella agglutinans TaxID=1644129 RepID=A0ABT6M3X7_9NOCA|nr:LuxR C-terminal-related transcriptional regulator [Prescottella agglutinans]MDH6279016.1 putative ATPase/DNA-binding CsgD family transcriptional regulator [Prescottella agglutinans]
MPSTSSRRRRGGNLPSELTSFVDRRHELGEARRLLAAGRLLTLTGIGGVGKTRLAMRVAADAERAFADGVWFVELADLSEPDLLADTVAGVFGVRGQSGRPALDLLTEYLEERQVLVVLDNCEHLLDAVAGLVTALLRNCADVRMFVTSREPIGMAGEVVLQVPPLIVPNVDGSSAPEPTASDAVTLFAERAAAVVPGFAVTDANRRAIAEICRRLDGLPLPIELAAARMRSLSADEIRRRLTDRFELLTGGSRLAPSRQQALRLCVDWSHDLCTPVEQLVWARLSVFVGGFDLGAAESLCADDLAAGDVLDVVSSLVDKSIVVCEIADRTVRYRMLETIAQYGRERLAAMGELSTLRRRHRDWFAGLVAHADRQWFGSGQPGWANRLNREQANIRAALEYCASEPGEAVVGVRMSAALHAFWLCRGRLAEGQHWIQNAIAGSEDEPDPDRVKVLCAASQFAAMRGAFDVGDAFVEHAHRLADRLGDRHIRALVTDARGRMEMVRGVLDDAVDRFTDSLGTFRALGDVPGTILALQGLGIVHGMGGDQGLAVSCHEEVLAITESLGEYEHRARAMWLLGLEMWNRSDRTRAAELATTSLRLSRAVDDHFAAEGCIELLSWVCADDGRPERAATLSGAAETLSRAMGTPPAAIPTTRGHHDAARRRARRELGDRAFDNAFGRGFEMGFADAVDYALDERSDTEAEPAPTETPLTRRERQVAALVARGLTNREIASELVIAQRTAEGHVENVLTKLGFGSRAQIAAWVAESERG